MLKRKTIKLRRGQKRSQHVHIGDGVALEAHVDSLPHHTLTPPPIPCLCPSRWSPGHWSGPRLLPRAPLHTEAREAEKADLTLLPPCLNRRGPAPWGERRPVPTGPCPSLWPHIIPRAVRGVPCTERSSPWGSGLLPSSRFSGP